MKTISKKEKAGNPLQFTPLNELEVCSNKLIGGVNIIGINNFAPILIGDGRIPSVWIYTRPDNKKWIPLVQDSQSNHPSIYIDKNTLTREVKIKIENTIVLNAKMQSDKACVVSAIDLRPIGLNVHGNDKEFKVGNSSFSKNTVRGASFMIGLD